MPGRRRLSDLFFPHGEFRAKVLLAIIRSRRFIHIRWLIIATILLLVSVERWLNPQFRRPRAIELCTLALAAINTLWMLVGRSLLRRGADQEPPPPELLHRVVWFVNGQMIVDLLFLTAVLRYSGGIENPMVIFYLLHMLIAAMLLRPANALLQGAWAVLLFGGLVFGEYFGWIAPHYPFLAPPAGSSSHADWMHALTTTGVLATGVLATLYFTLQISARLDEQEARLRGAMDALQRSQEAIRDLQARRSRFMQTAAHQLKSPLAGVQTLAGLIHDGVVPAEAVRPTCARIIQRCREGISQVGELLTLARIQEADPTRPGQELANARQVLLKLCQRFQPVAREKQIDLSWELPRTRDLLVRIDPASLADCLGNLIDNAIKYTPGPGRVTVTLRPGDVLRAAPPDEPAPQPADAPSVPYVSITVADTGMGIEPDALAASADPNSHRSIFDAFLRGNNALAAGIPGTGLGLAIVREIVEQAGGRIAVRSAPGRGSAFTVVLPTPLAPTPPDAVKSTRSTVVVLPMEPG